MCIVKPIFTLNTLNHELVFYFVIVLCLRQPAVAIDIEKCIIINVLVIWVIFSCWFNLAWEWHSWVTTVTSKISLIIKLVDFVTLMARNHTSQTETMSGNFFCKILLFHKFVIWRTQLFNITCLTRINRLVGVATFISAFANILWNNV